MPLSHPPSHTRSAQAPGLADDVLAKVMQSTDNLAEHTTQVGRERGMRSGSRGEK